MSPTEGWISFKDAWPPQSKALDNPSIVTTDKVLVTNNIDARDRMGRMSHVWLAAPVGTRENPKAFTDGDHEIHGITHWKAVL